MDLLDFDSAALYFEQPLRPETERLLMEAAHRYGEPAAEAALLRAYFLEPGHLTVLVALYRFFFYQHRYADALLVADRALVESIRLLAAPVPWQRLSETDLARMAQVSMPLTRFYLLVLKGAGYLKLRMGEFPEALDRLSKVAELDQADRMAVKPLIEIAQQMVERQGAERKAG
jgi:tetratricopeptide (TPR) repeat protein